MKNLSETRLRLEKLQKLTTPWNQEVSDAIGEALALIQDLVHISYTQHREVMKARKVGNAADFLEYVKGQMGAKTQTTGAIRNTVVIDELEQLFLTYMEIKGYEERDQKESQG